MYPSVIRLLDPRHLVVVLIVRHPPWCYARPLTGGITITHSSHLQSSCTHPPISSLFCLSPTVEHFPLPRYPAATCTSVALDRTSMRLYKNSFLYWIYWTHRHYYFLVQSSVRRRWFFFFLSLRLGQHQIGMDVLCCVVSRSKLFISTGIYHPSPVAIYARKSSGLFLFLFFLTLVFNHSFFILIIFMSLKQLSVSHAIFLFLLLLSHYQWILLWFPLFFFFLSFQFSYCVSRLVFLLFFCVSQSRSSWFCDTLLAQSFK